MIEGLTRAAAGSCAEGANVEIMSKLKLAEEKRAKVKFGAVSIPESILEEIDRLIEELGYWPSRSTFAREACLEKIERERERLEKLRRKGGEE